jgi:Trk K+ transport system NAD-binding subunit
VYVSSKISAEIAMIGSDPIGETFARHLVENGKGVILIDAGS